MSIEVDIRVRKMLRSSIITRYISTNHIFTHKAYLLNDEVFITQFCSQCNYYL